MLANYLQQQLILRTIHFCSRLSRWPELETAPTVQSGMELPSRRLAPIAGWDCIDSQRLLQLFWEGCFHCIY
jgi:hypothetical protein